MFIYIRLLYYTEHILHYEVHVQIYNFELILLHLFYEIYAQTYDPYSICLRYYINFMKCILRHITLEKKNLYSTRIS